MRVLAFLLLCAVTTSISLPRFRPRPRPFGPRPFRPWFRSDLQTAELATDSDVDASVQAGLDIDRYIHRLYRNR